MLAVLRQLHAEAALTDLLTPAGDDRGYVEDVGETLVLIALASDQGMMAGFSVIRVEDIRLARWNEARLRAWHSALVYDGVSRKRSGPVRLEDWASAIVDVVAQERLLSFHLDDPDRVFIGTDVTVEDGIVRANQITPEGVKDGCFAFSTERLRRIDFGGPYERGLERMLTLTKA